MTHTEPAAPLALDRAIDALTATSIHDRKCCEHRVMDVAENDAIDGYDRPVEGEAGLVEQARALFEGMCSCDENTPCEGGSAACAGTIPAEFIDTEFPYCPTCRIAAHADSVGDEPIQGPQPEQVVKVIEIETGETVHVVDVTGRTERQVDRVVAGMLINLDHDRFCVD